MHVSKRPVEPEAEDVTTVSDPVGPLSLGWWLGETLHLDKSYYEAIGSEYVSQIVKSPLLLEEDVEALLAVDPDLCKRGYLGLFQRPVVAGLKVITGLGITGSMVWLRRQAYVSGRLALMLASGIVAGAGLAWAIREGRLGLHLALLQRQHTRNIDAVTQLLSTQTNISSLMNRSLRIIQEIELISRGYNVSSAAPLAPVTRMEQHDKRRMSLPLRTTLYNVAFASLRQFRWHTNKLIERFPLSMTVDYSGTYLAGQRLKQLGRTNYLSISDILCRYL